MKNEAMAYYQAPIYQHYKKVMAFVLRIARKNGVEVTNEEWKRTADVLLEKWSPEFSEKDRAMMYAWADYLKKTL